MTWHQANRNSDMALSPDILPGVSDTKSTTMGLLSAHACLRHFICARWHRLFVWWESNCSLSTAFPTKWCVSEMSARIGVNPRRFW